MKLSLWTYEGPPHIGAMRVVNSLSNAHLMLHAPQGDTYADLLFTMIERQGRRPPVTYTTFQARDLGGDTANLVVSSLQEVVDRFAPEVLFVGESCTAELIQDQPGSLAKGMSLGRPIIPVELPAYSRKENFGASETFYALVRGVLNRRGEKSEATPQPQTQLPTVNLLGPTSLGFRARDDVKEIVGLLESLGVIINCVAPLGASLDDIRRLPEAQLNLCICPETALTACEWLQREYEQPFINIVPIGVSATREFITAVCDALDLDTGETLQSDASRLPWYSRSIDSNYLTGKRVFVFGDASHAVAAARIAVEELGFDLVGLGSYSRENARIVRAAAQALGVEALITDDYLEVEAAVKEAEPELVLGTQMERHIAKRLGIACCVISAPFHVEDCPARYSPQMGYEGANVIFDTWIHPLMMGLEEHLLGMFRDDFEFNEVVAPSHLGAHAGSADDTAIANANAQSSDENNHKLSSQAITWSVDAEQELKKIPFFVRKKARRNTELYAHQQGLPTINLETLYDAKAHFS